MKKTICILFLIVTGASIAQIKTFASINGEKVNFDPNNVWKLTGNSGTSPATHFLGTLDDVDLILKRNNEKIGILSTRYIAFGIDALKVNTGINNSALGNNALKNNTTGGENVALGYDTLLNNSTGTNNIASGTGALRNNTTASYNISIGANSLSANTSGSQNVVLGANAMAANNGTSNVVIGVDTFKNSTSGDRNTIVGYNTANDIIAGSANTIIGANVTGLSPTLSNNIIIADGDGNQRINVDAMGNVGLGTTAPTVRLDVNGSAKVSANLTASNVYSTGKIGIGTMTPSAEFDVIGNGKVSGTVTAASYLTTSDERLKRNIKNIDKGLELIQALRPVSYEKKSSMQTNDFKKENGFIAQEVRKVLPSIVKEEKDSDRTLGVNYLEIIPILTKAIQEQEKQLLEQEVQIELQQSQIEKILKNFSEKNIIVK